MKHKGFTLIEILLVIGIIGILASLVISNLLTSRDRAFDAERKSDLRQYQSRLQGYSTNNKGLYPAYNSSKNIIELCTDSYLGTAYCADDPKGLNYKYLSTGTTNDGSATAQGYVIWAKLQKCKDGGLDCYWYACSNGKTDELPGSTEPTTAACGTF